MFGTIVNSAAIIAGALIGLMLRRGLPEKYKEIVMQGIGLAVAMIGLKMALKTSNEIIIIISLVIGGILGEIIGIEKYLEKFGKKVQSLVSNGEGDFVKGFVTSSLVYCVGAMSIMGAIESGLTGQHSVLYAKATLDGVSSIIFASTMGWGVLFSSIAVLIYQGAITLLAESIKAFITDAIMMEMTATGGLLIIGIASNMMGIKQFKIGNLLPAVFIAAFITAFI